MKSPIRVTLLFFMKKSSWGRGEGRGGGRVGWGGAREGSAQARGGARRGAGSGVALPCTQGRAGASRLGRRAGWQGLRGVACISAAGRLPAASTHQVVKLGDLAGAARRGGAGLALGACGGRSGVSGGAVRAVATQVEGARQRGKKGICGRVRSYGAAAAAPGGGARRRCRRAGPGARGGCPVPIGLREAPHAGYSGCQGAGGASAVQGGKRPSAVPAVWGAPPTLPPRSAPAIATHGPQRSGPGRPRGPGAPCCTWWVAAAAGGGCKWGEAAGTAPGTGRQAGNGGGRGAGGRLEVLGVGPQHAHSTSKRGGHYRAFRLLRAAQHAICKRMVGVPGRGGGGRPGPRGGAQGRVRHPAQGASQVLRRLPIEIGAARWRSQAPLDAA